MKRETKEKIAVTVVLTLWWLLCPVVGYGPAADATGTVATTLAEHCLYVVSHGNVWHLLGNLFVLWLIPGRLWLWQSVVIAFLCSWLPVIPGVWDIIPLGEPADTVKTVGFSGALFGIIGVQWGRWCRKEHEVGCRDRAAYWTFSKKVMPFVAIGTLIPHVNWSIHLYCVIAGVAYGRWRK